MRAFIFILLGAFCAGCISPSHPKQSKTALHDLQPFQGVYTNHSEGRTLGAVIPGLKGGHEADVIRVRVSGECITVQALLKGNIIGEKVFLSGRDFHLFNSKINVPHGTWGGATLGASAYMIPIPPAAGGGVTSGSLFLNRDKNLVFRDKATGGLLIFYVIPTLVMDRNDIVFNRLSQ